MNPHRQVGWRSVQPSSRFAFAFEAPRISVITVTPASPASRRASPRGSLLYDSAGGPVWVAALEIAEGVVVTVRSILNPDKLRTSARTTRN